MPLTVPPTDAELFNLIAADLGAKTLALGGIFSQALDPFHVLELLAEAPGKFRVILAELGEDTVGDARRAGAVDMLYTVTVSNNRGLPFVTGANRSIDRTNDEPSLMKRATEIRDWLRGLVMPEGTSLRLDYRGRKPVTYEGAVLDAYELTFRLQVGLPIATPRP